MMIKQFQSELYFSLKVFCFFSILSILINLLVSYRLSEIIFQYFGFVFLISPLLITIDASLRKKYSIKKFIKLLITIGLFWTLLIASFHLEKAILSNVNIEIVQENLDEAIIDNPPNYFKYYLIISIILVILMLIFKLLNYTIDFSNLNRNKSNLFIHQTLNLKP